MDNCCSNYFYDIFIGSFEANAFLNCELIILQLYLYVCAEDLKVKT